MAVTPHCPGLGTQAQLHSLQLPNLMNIFLQAFGQKFQLPGAGTHPVRRHQECFSVKKKKKKGRSSMKQFALQSVTRLISL